jgi:hypothetical protein
MQAFETLVRNCIVLPFDEDAAGVAATVWSVGWCAMASSGT